MSQIHWAALCAITTMLCVPGSSNAEPVSLWNLNGSVISLEVDGPALAFRYDKPRKGMRDEGVRSGTLLFSGTREGDAVSGTGYVFSRRCGALPYPVTGVAVDERTFRLYGSSPIALGKDCRPLKFQHDVNVFTLLKPIAAPAVIPSEPDKVAAAEQDRLAEARRAEEQRLAELRAFAKQREACRGSDIAACDKALRSPYATPEDLTALRSWREAAVTLSAALKDCEAGTYTACTNALASSALAQDARTRVMAWQRRASPIAKAYAYIEEVVPQLKDPLANASTSIRNLLPSSEALKTQGSALARFLAFILVGWLVITAAQRCRGVAANAGASIWSGVTALWSKRPHLHVVLSRISEAAAGYRQSLTAPRSTSRPAAASTEPKPSRALTPVKDRDTPGAIAAMELAMAYIEEVRAADSPGVDDEDMRKAQLNTLSLATKQIERAEKLDPDAILEGEDKDGLPFRISVTEMKAEALFLEGVTHHVFDLKRSIPALVKATALNPNDPRPFYVLGVTHAANRNKKRAVAALERAVALDPKNLQYRKELNRVENMTAAEIAGYKATRAGERVFDTGVGVVNAGIRVWNVGVICWNIFAFTYNVLTFPLRLVLRIAHGAR
jgi:tetratricopeptide (TPR) repeat protein